MNKEQSRKKRAKHYSYFKIDLWMPNFKALHSSWTDSIFLWIFLSYFKMWSLFLMLLTKVWLNQVIILSSESFILLSFSSLRRHNSWNQQWFFKKCNGKTILKFWNLLNIEFLLLKHQTAPFLTLVIFSMTSAKELSDSEQKSFKIALNRNLLASRNLLLMMQPRKTSAH